ncbi:hypothetical protein H310_05214 [Aphanomyces invadans]|uniref:Uncharacterized protein n=1 Tax=Aphanomyces invadans TaxID=157072 RepID=A0A024UC76_9STRA|nr:hypothetical protein H310_05214 [Aphanomyces invadans]ETW03864.1 hypothetical protein H310_05214 [Aphanomyces invadans]|eukprot:XP_008868093.1 hypothetical protein H310_05214 [Aphanomyces invadans]
MEAERGYCKKRAIVHELYTIMTLAASRRLHDASISQRHRRRGRRGSRSNQVLVGLHKEELPYVCGQVVTTLLDNIWSRRRRGEAQHRPRRARQQRPSLRLPFPPHEGVSVGGRSDRLFNQCRVEIPRHFGLNFFGHPWLMQAGRVVHACASFVLRLSSVHRQDARRLCLVRLFRRRTGRLHARNELNQPMPQRLLGRGNFVR